MYHYLSWGQNTSVIDGTASFTCTCRQVTVTETSVSAVEVHTTLQIIHHFSIKMIYSTNTILQIISIT
jgi:hypothetical protein